MIGKIGGVLAGMYFEGCEAQGPCREMIPFLCNILYITTDDNNENEQSAANN